MSAATAGVSRASAVVSANASALDGHLFAARNLLALRARLNALGDAVAVAGPPDVDVIFGGSNGASAAAAAAASAAAAAAAAAPPLTSSSSSSSSSFSLSSAGSALAAAAAPHATSRAALDARAALERSSRAAASAAVGAAARAAVGPLLSFMTKVAAVRMSSSSAANASSNPAQPLSSHAFAARSRVAEVAASVRQRLGMSPSSSSGGGGGGGGTDVNDDDPSASLPAAAALAKLYVPDQVARSGLWEPVKVAVRDAISQARGLIEAEYGSSGEGGEGEDIKIELPSDGEVVAALSRVLV